MKTILCYRKTAHPRTRGGYQGWKETMTADTLNAFDNTEKRTSVLVLEHHPNDSRIKIDESDICQTLSQRMGTGGGQRAVDNGVSQ